MRIGYSGKILFYKEVWNSRKTKGAIIIFIKTSLYK